MIRTGILPFLLLLLGFTVHAADCTVVAKLRSSLSYARELGEGTDSTDLTRRAIAYLKENAHLPATEKALLWEGFAEVIKGRDPDWRSYRSRGSQQEWIYQGEGGHLLVIGRDGRVYRSIKRESHLVKDGWELDYGNLRPL